MNGLLESIARLRREVCALHAELTHYQLVVWTAGNVSARVPGYDLMVNTGHMDLDTCVGIIVAAARVKAGLPPRP